MIRVKRVSILVSLLILGYGFVFGQSDVGVKLIISPVGGYNLSYKEIVTVMISNYGSDVVSNIPLSYKINNAVSYTDTAKISINPGQNYNYTFKTNADLSMYGSYFIKAFTSLEGDINNLNDTARLNLYNLKRTYCVSQSYYSDFENIGMVKIGSFVNGSATPVYNNITKCINTYSDFTSSLAPVKLIPDSVYNIQISQINYSEKFNSCFINVFIDYNADGEFDFYTERVWGKMTLPTETTVSGNFKVKSSANKGITRMRIVMAEGTDATVARECGYYNWGETEDYNVVISPFLNLDAGVTDIISPSDKEGEDAIIPVKVVVRNYGSAEINSMNILFRLNQAAPVSYHWNGSLKAFKSTTVQLPDLKVPAYINNICAFTEIQNDTNTFNDQFCKSFYGNPKIDLGPVALLNPRIDDCYTSAQSVTVRVKAFGSQPVDFSKNNLIITANVSGANSALLIDTVKFGIIGVNDSIDVVLKNNFDMTAGGDYNFNISTFITGDGVPTNNSLPLQTINVFPIVSSFPYIENFESFTTGNPGTITDGWKSESPDYYRWQVNNGPVPTFGTGPLVDHTYGTRDGKYIYVEADSAGGPTYFVSSCFDISSMNKPYLTFWYHMAGKDINKLQIDIYNGSQWISNVFSLSGSQQNDVNDPWKQAMIDLTNYKGIIKIRFVSLRGSGSSGDIAIDDFSIFEPQNSDLGVFAFVQPDPFYASVGASQTMSVSLRNYGITNITSAKVGYIIDNLPPVIETWNGNLAPKAVFNYTFSKPFTVKEGTYSVCAFVSVTDDGNNFNDTLCVNFSGVLPLSPYKEDFESFSSNNNSDFKNGWIQEFVTEYKWKVGQGPLNDNLTGPAIDHTTGTSDGKYMFTDASFGSNGDIASIVSPPVDLKVYTHPKLSFWFHFYGSDIASMFVEIYSAGKWTSIKELSKQVQTYQTADWNKMIVDLSAYKGIIKLRFRGIRGNGTNGNMAIDDVSIYNSPAVDVSVQEISDPFMLGLTAGSTQKFSVILENRGLSNIKLLNVGFIVGNNSPVVEKFSGTILLNQSVKYSFTSSFIVPVGEFTAKCFVELLNDTVRANDTLVKKYMGVTQFNLPYADDFEGKNYWYSDDIINHWEYGKPDADFITLMSFNGKQSENCWVTNKSGNYKGEVEYNLYSPKFNFNNISGAVLNFWHFENSAQYTDGGRLMYSTDASPDWVTLGYLGDPNGTNWYNYNYYPQGKHCWIYVSNAAWINSSYKLTQLNNSTSPVRFKFSFFTNNSSNNLHRGWAIDNFSIKVPPQTIDAGVESIVAPSAYTPSASQVEVKAVVKNYGLNILTKIPLSYQIDNGTAELDTFKGTLKPDSSVVFTFKKKFTAKYAYYLCVSSNLSGDNNTLNNKYCFHSFIDAGIYWIENPIGQALIDTNATVTVLLKNFGIAELTSIDITYTIDGVPRAKETWTGHLLPGEITKYTFKTKLPKIPGTFSLCAYTTLFDDANASNNKICKSIVSTSGIEKITVDGISLYQNIPNPATDITTINYTLPEPAKTKLEIFNVYGVSVYSSQQQAPKGKNSYTVNVSNLPQGVYFYTLTLKGSRLTRSLIKSN